MIEKITLSGVKSYLGDTALPLRGLTAITGENSSGKSTLFQALLLLKQSMTGASSAINGLQLNGPLVSVGDYRDWSSRHSGSVSSICVEIRPDAIGTGETAAGGETRPIGLTDYPASWLGGAAPRCLRMKAHWTFADCGSENQSIAAVESADFSTIYAADEAEIFTATAFKRAPPPYPHYLNSPTEADSFRYRLKTVLPEPDPTNRRFHQYWAPPFEQEAVAIPIDGERHSAFLGVLPSEVLIDTRWSAAFPNLLYIVADIEIKTATYLESNLEGRPPTSSWKPANHLPERVTTEKQASAAIKFVTRCGRKDFSEFLRRSSMSSMLMHFFASIGEKREPRKFIVKLWEAACSRLSEEIGLPENLLALQMGPIVKMFPFLGAIAHPLGHWFEQNPRGTELLTRLLSICEENILLMEGTPFETYFAMAKKLRVPMSLNSPTNICKHFFAERILHLGPLRDDPRNLFLPSPPAHRYDVGKKGQQSIECLHRFGMDQVDIPLPITNQSNGVRYVPVVTDLLSAVSHWGKYLGLYSSLKIIGDNKYGTLCKIIQEHPEGEISSDLNNVGVGISQVLPVLLLCLGAPQGSCILLEQPELHLHPSVQSRLAELFIAVSQSGRQLILETHSEHIINRIRLAAAQERLGIDEFGVIFLERDEYGTSVSTISVQSDGRLDKWPKGFNDEAEKTLTQILRTRGS